MAECLNELLCTGGLAEKEPAYLCSLPARPQTQEKALSTAGMGRDAPFTLGLWETSPPYCAAFAYDPFFFPEVSVREESAERSQNSSNPPTARPLGLWQQLYIGLANVDMELLSYLLP